MHLAKLPLLLHLVVESFAAAAFISRPQLQVSHGASPETVLIFNSYGGLLLATDVLCFLFLLRDGFDDATVMVALSLAIHHFFAMWRAYTRIKRGLGVEGPQGKLLGGPMVHLITHSICCLSLGMVGVFGHHWSI